MNQPNRIDSLISKISPLWAMKRLKARRSLSYEAAISTRLRGFRNARSSPNDFTESRDRIQIIKQARDLQQNFGLFASIIRKLSIYSLGRVRYRAHTGNDRINEQIDRYIKGRSVKCDVSQRFSLAEVARMSLAETLVPGDVFIAFRDDERGTSPQIIEADRVGGEIDQWVKQDEVGGVKFDPDTGRVIEYKVYDRAPSGAFINLQSVPADSMIQVMDPERYDRYRGISPFAPVINDMRDLKEVMAACLVGVKFNEYHAGFISGGSGVPHDPSGYFGSSSADTRADGAKENETMLHPGMMQYLPEGYTADLVKSERPSGQFQSYLELLIRTIANAIGLPFGFVYSLSGLGGPGARMDAAQSQRIIEYWQSIIDDRLLTPISSRWILDGVAQGEIESPSGVRLFEGDWQFPPRITIDVGRESQAGINEIRAGLRTRADWWEEEGKDARAEMEVVRDEAKSVIEMAKGLAEETGVPYERVLDMLDMRVGNGTPSLDQTSQGKIADPEDSVDPNAAPADTGGDSIEDVSLNGAQISSLLEILVQVSTGLLTPESAKSLITSAFPSITDVMADRILAGTATEPVVQELAARGKQTKLVRGKPLTVALDFDGTVVKNAWPEIGDSVGAERVLRRVIDAGGTLILWTMRTGEEREAALRWFMDRDIPIEEPDADPASGKVSADVYIDDRAAGIPVIGNSVEGTYVDWSAMEMILFGEVELARK